MTRALRPGRRPGRRHGRRAAVTWAASALIHVLLLGWLAHETPAFDPLLLPSRGFQIELVPAAPSAQAVGKAELSDAPRPAPTAPPRVRPARHTQVETTTPYPLPARNAARPIPRFPSPGLARPASPAPAPLKGAGPIGPAAGAAGSLQGSSTGAGADADADGAGVQGALRTSVGCQDPDFFNLNKAERAECHRVYGAQAAIGAGQYVDPISSAKIRNDYERAREACERINHYATPLDSDSEHSAKAPDLGIVGNFRARLHC
jgi:hypothetical protein